VGPDEIVQRRQGHAMLVWSENGRVFGLEGGFSLNDLVRMAESIE
jgi:hypothetical protein